MAASACSSSVDADSGRCVESVTPTEAEAKIVPSAVIGERPALVGAGLFAIANFGYQAALIYYDSTLPTVSTPAARGRLSGTGVAVG